MLTEEPVLDPVGASTTSAVTAVVPASMARMRAAVASLTRPHQQVGAG
jgi:hypothetical protein